MIIPTHEIKNEVYNFNFDEQDKQVRKVLKDTIEDNAITIQGTVYPIKGGFDVSGEIKTKAPVFCSFCANKIAIPVVEKFHEVMLYAPKLTRAQREAEEVLKSDDLEMNYISGTEIDLSDIVKEIINVSVPIQPKCAEKGAPAHFPKCVADWDYEKYFKETDASEKANPFAVLKNLKKN